MGRNHANIVRVCATREHAAHLLVHGSLDDSEVSVVRGAASLQRMSCLVGRDLDCGGRLETASVVKVGADDESVLEVIGP